MKSNDVWDLLENNQMRQDFWAEMDKEWVCVDPCIVGDGCLGWSILFSLLLYTFEIFF